MVISAFGAFAIAMPHFFGSPGRLEKAAIRIGNNRSYDLCHPNQSAVEDCDDTYKDWGSMVVIFFGIFSFGIGVSFYYSFGVPYVDDNTEKIQSPLLLSIIMSAKTLGPSLGYALGGA